LETVDGASASVFLLTLVCEAGLIGAFVPAEAAVLALVLFVFSAEMEDRGFGGVLSSGMRECRRSSGGWCFVAVLLFCHGFSFLFLNFLSKLLLSQTRFGCFRLGRFSQC
jgi:hypothetical protein